MIKSFQYRIYPNKKQEVILNKTLSTCRNLYNNTLSERKHQSEMNNLKSKFQVFPWSKQEWITKYDQSATLTKNKTTFQKEVYSQVLQNVILRVDKSYKRFFKGSGYPRFKGKNRYNSFTYPGSGFEIVDNILSLSKIGNIKIIVHRPIEGTIKTCTIKKDIDQWYATFSCEIDIPIPIVETNSKIGIDVGLTSLLTLSNGTKVEPPKFLRLSEKRLSREQIKFSKKKLKSKNRNKQRIKVAKVHRTIRNQRKDFNHKLSRRLVNTYDLIAFEDLQIQNMMQNHCLAKSISDASWYNLQQFTLYKAEYAGKQVKFVNPSGTSMTCNICGFHAPKDLSVRIHNCPNCGIIMPRDQMSAIIIEDRCLKKHNMVGTTKFQACVSSLSIDTMTQEAPML